MIAVILLMILLVACGPDLVAALLDFTADLLDRHPRLLARLTRD